MSQLRVLISRPDRLGDVILSTPIPREIKKKYPESFVALLLRPYTKDIYLNNPYVDAIITYDPEDKNNNLLEKVKEIRQFKFTHALMLLPNERVNYMLFLSGIFNRIGVGYKFYQFITFVQSVSRKKYIPLRHEADYCMDLARKLGIATDNLDCEIHLTENEKQSVQKIRKKILKDGNVVVGIHSTSGKSAPNWEAERYLELLHKLKNISNIKIVVTDNIPPEILDNIEGVEYPNKGSDLRSSILNFAALDLLVSASTGPMHIAAALKVKTVALFCRLKSCSPELWGPKGNSSVIIMPDKENCNKFCNDDPKHCRFKDRHNISVEEVYEKIVQFI
ncbi:MAG: glycosyltransferase family 9 protein [Bacteroidota bacterium]|nr:glycosyltransferase family 9 protein [Bacteroidota bacterium]